MSTPANVTPIRRPVTESRPLEWMTETEASKHTRIPVQTLRSWRRDGAVRVLPFHKIGRLVRYERHEVDEALAAGRVEVTQ